MTGTGLTPSVECVTKIDLSVRGGVQGLGTESREEHKASPPEVLLVSAFLNLLPWASYLSISRSVLPGSSEFVTLPVVLGK